MRVPLFVIGTFIVQGGLVALIMWLLTAADRAQGREQDAIKRLTEFEAEEERPGGSPTKPSPRLPPRTAALR
jgi:hypothetical protein